MLGNSADNTQQVLIWTDWYQREWDHSVAILGDNATMLCILHGNVKKASHLHQTTGVRLVNNWCNSLRYYYYYWYLWHKGILNCANYSRKHHAPKHHEHVCPFFVFDNTKVPKQWSNMSPHQSWQHICYSVSTPWSTVLNKNTGWLFTCKGGLIT